MKLARLFPDRARYCPAKELPDIGSYLIGLAFGGFCFFPEWLLQKLLPSVPPAGIVLPIIVSSALAGATATLFARESTGVRSGIHAGIVSAFAGSSFLVVLGILRGARSDELLGVELLALLSFPPAISLGFIGAVAVTLAKNPPSLLPRPQPASAPTPHGRNFLFRSVIGLSLLCYLAPLLFLAKPEATPMVKSAVPISATAPTPVPWRYITPANFSSLPGRTIGMVDEKRIPAIDGNSPMAISPDGTRFSFFTRNGQQATLEVLNLDTFEPVATFAFPRPFNEMAWSPDSKRIFYVPQKSESLAGVVDIEKNQLIALPLPKNKHIPNALPYWWRNTEVLFPRDGEILDLETLQLLPADKLASWNALSDADRERWSKSPPNSWTMPKSRTFEILSRITDYDFAVAGDGERTTRYDVMVSDNGAAFSRLVASVDLQPGDRLLNAADGSKLILVRENSAEVFYMGTIDSEATFSVALPQKDATRNASLFVCSAVVNPRNGKVVGPDRDHVKAIARIIDWKDGKATCWVEQEYEPVQVGDIAGDFHAWEDGNLKLISASWGKVEPADSSTKVPARSEAPALNNVSSVSFDTPHAVATVSDIHRKVSSSVPELTPATSASTTSRPGADIENFIRAHHQKSSASDVVGVTNDYANQVEYFDHGVVTRDFIRKDVAAYHAGHTLAEEVLGNLSVQAVEGDMYAVNYQANVLRRNSRTGKWMRVVAAVELEIAWTPDGFKIVSQHAKILNKEQSP